ncbi:hypothetical protein Tco_0532637 [Tanacetum coccineum]
MPSFPSPEPTVSYFDDLDYFKDFEKDFPAIVYDDALTSKLDFVTEPSNNPQKIDEFNLKDETFLSECDEEEQNVLYFNDPFPFNIIYPDDSKSNKDDDDKKIDTEQPSGDIYVIPVPDDINTDVGAYAQGLNMLLKTNIALPPRDQRHQYLRFEGLEYTDADITDFEEILGRIYGRGIHRVQVFDFGGLTDLMAEGLSGRMLMEHRDAQGQTRALQFQLGGFRRHISWREFLLGMGLHTAEEIELVGFGVYWAESARQIPDKGDLSAYLIRDPMLRLCHRLIACSIAQRSQAPEKVTVTDMFYMRGMDVAEHFGLLTEERLQGLIVIIRDLPVIDMAELVRLQICEELDDTWAWVAPGPERQPDVAAGAPKVAEGAPDVDEGDQAVLYTPLQEPSDTTMQLDNIGLQTQRITS